MVLEYQLKEQYLRSSFWFSGKWYLLHHDNQWNSNRVHFELTKTKDAAKIM
jgi:hypothetical protein